MSEMLSEWLVQLASWSPLEIAAVVFAILYLLLAIRENIWCWFCAGVSTAIYVHLYYDAKLYMESALNVFYFAMAIYGWRVWRTGAVSGEKIAVTTLTWNVHFVAAAVMLALVFVTGVLLDLRTDAAYPYIDSATTYFAMWATFLVARKVLENWWYWLLIDVVSIYIYWSRGLELTALLFVVYVLMIPFGLYRWTQSWREQMEARAS